MKEFVLSDDFCHTVYVRVLVWQYRRNIYTKGFETNEPWHHSSKFLKDFFFVLISYNDSLERIAVSHSFSIPRLFSLTSMLSLRKCWSAENTRLFIVTDSRFYRASILHEQVDRKIDRSRVRLIDSDYTINISLRLRSYRWKTRHHRTRLPYLFFFFHDFYTICII